MNLRKAFSVFSVSLWLFCCGCRAVYVDHRADGTTRVYAASILTSPTIGTLTWQTPAATVSLSGYGSKSEVSGADLAAAAMAALKVLAVIP